VIHPIIRPTAEPALTTRTCGVLLCATALETGGTFGRAEAISGFSRRKEAPKPRLEEHVIGQECRSTERARHAIPGPPGAPDRRAASVIPEPPPVSPSKCTLEDGAYLHRRPCPAASGRDTARRQCPCNATKRSYAASLDVTDHRQHVRGVTVRSPSWPRPHVDGPLIVSDFRDACRVPWPP
jgi:hypothetical protein